ncbi:MAG TPA: PAS domain-containing protein, partial [Methanobacterium sp.]|nr:PAS domain-containing protein [Methanobacterium sp.]
ITKQKLAESALKKSEEKYRRLFNDDLTGDFIATTHGELIDCNPAFVEIYGLKNVQDSIGMDISQFNYSDWQEIVTRLLAEHKIKSHQSSHKRPDGKNIQIIANIIGIFNDSDELVQIKGYVFEITDC